MEAPIRQPAHPPGRRRGSPHGDERARLLGVYGREDELAGLDPVPEAVVDADVVPADSPAIRFLNLVVAVGAVVAFLPVMGLIGLAIKLESHGPVLYRQPRIGLDRRGLHRARRFGVADSGRPAPSSVSGRRSSGSGRPSSVSGRPSADGRRTADLGGKPFVIYKFRTMHLHAEQETGPVWASTADRRATRVGRFLRHYRLDELPQFLNVLRGEMSVVGPRPERPSFVQRLRQEFGHYPLRQRVPPGITGWAQVNQNPDRTLDDVRIKLRYDLEYVRHRSLGFDLKIMLRTLPAVLEGEHGRAGAEGRQARPVPGSRDPSLLNEGAQ